MFLYIGVTCRFLPPSYTAKSEKSEKMFDHVEGISKEALDFPKDVLA